MTDATVTGPTGRAASPVSQLTPIRGRRWLPFLLGFAVIWAVLALPAQADAGGDWRVPSMVAVLVAVLVVERIAFGVPFRAAIGTLGLGRPGWRPVAVAVAVSALVLLVFPLTAALTGARLALVEGWPLVLIGLFAYHGIAEEAVWRGFGFRHLAVGRSYWRAVLWSMPLIVVAHIPIIAQGGPVIGIGAMLVAAATSIPTAHLYLGGRGTLWAPAILHLAIDAFKLVVVPVAATTAFALLLIGISLLIPLLALLAPRAWLLGGRRS